MSGSHFGSGYWPDDYFGLYFQPEAGGVIVGALAGSFAGTSSFSGTLEAPSAGHSGVVRLAQHMRQAQANRWEVLGEYFDSIRKKPAPEIVEAVKEELAEARTEARGVTDPKVITWKRRAAKALKPAGPATLPRTQDIAWQRLVEDTARLERAVMALRTLREEAARVRFEQEQEEEELLLLAA